MYAYIKLLFYLNAIQNSKVNKFKQSLSVPDITDIIQILFRIKPQA